MMMLLPVVLHLGPWTGPSLATATAGAAKYKLTVHGKPHESVPLTASGLPKGWVAAFCTERFCAPYRFTLPLDSRGAAIVELTLVRVDDAAPKRVRVTISSPGVRSVQADARV